MVCINLNGQANASVHGDCQWLGTTHTSKASGGHKLALEGTAEVLAGPEARLQRRGAPVAPRCAS